MKIFLTGFCIKARKDTITHKKEKRKEREELSLSLPSQSSSSSKVSLYISRKSKYNESLLFVFNGEKFSRLLFVFDFFFSRERRDREKS